MSSVPPLPYAATLGALADAHPLLGLALLHHRTTRGGPLSFGAMPYLVEPYRDLPRLDGADAVKAVQTGWTDMLVQFAFERSGWAGRAVVYVLPKGRARDDFVQTRVDPLLLRVPAYRARLPGGDPSLASLTGSGEPVDEGAPANLRIKRFGPGTLRFLGSNVPDEFVEFSADVLIVDEHDHCDEDNLRLAVDRLRASPNPQHFRVGNPTSPGRGIARLFDEGDGRRWHWRCSPCGERQPLDWEANVVRRNDVGRWVARDEARASDLSVGDVRPVCRRCSAPFDRIAQGAAWVAARPTERRRSYTMSRLDVLSQSVRALVDEWGRVCANPDAALTFRRSVLGEPYDAEGTRLTVGALARLCVGPPVDRQGGDEYAARVVTAGIDVGAVLHVVVSVVERREDGSTVRRNVLICTVGSFEAAYDLLLRYRVRLAVFDAGPEIHAVAGVRDRAKAAGGRLSVWLCRFHAGERVGSDAYAMKLDHKARVATVDRTQLLDATYEEVVGSPATVVFPSDALAVDGWGKQICAPVRKLSDDRSRYVWDEGSAPDHFRLASAYDRVAADLLSRGGRYLVFDRDADEAQAEDEPVVERY